MIKTLVVIPAYNEEQSIVSVVSGLVACCPGLDYLVVNDGSTDGTARLCADQGFALLDLPTNLGLAGAVRAGMRFACDQGYDAVVQFDSDGQHRPEYLPSLLAPLDDGYDIVCASRFLDARKPLSMRMMGSRLIALAIRLTTGVRLTDPTSGQRAYHRRVFKQFVTEPNMTPEPDTVSFLIKCGARVTEVPVRMDERRFGSSYLTALRSTKYMLRIAISIIILQPFRLRCDLGRQQ
ncbi:MAG: glycosyltransferase family 2 protein [Coriobacteriales bacterium]|jgi:glycosyltransferase involved in cell wall biosynthesis|nr:glycosyltransferase family 2 protein [Coriobacteriales bacterium]